jgi:hypothetical protein
MRRVLVSVLCLALTGCGGFSSAVIKMDSLAFNDVIEDTTNKLLVLNVLRARDKAPLHFADIPVIRESMQQSASISWLHFAPPLQGTTSRSSRTMGAGVQFTPSFELTHLHSKEFHTGIATPIDAKFVKYWLDRGLDRRIVLLLFFSSAEIVETRSEKGPTRTIRIMNSPREALEAIRAWPPGADTEEATRCDTQSDFQRYLKLLNTLQTFFAHSYRERRLLASGVDLGLEKDPRNLQSFAALDQNKIQLVYDRGRKSYNVYALSPDPKIAFCLAESADPEARAMTGDFEMIGAGDPMARSAQNCFRPVVDIGSEDSTRTPIPESPLAFPGAAARKPPSTYCGIYNRFTGIERMPKGAEYPKLELRLHLRSVGEIFQFLGDLVYYQEGVKTHLERNAQLGLKLNTPVTFGYCGDKPTPGCDDIFLRLDPESCDSRFSVQYRDRTYRVSNFRPSGDRVEGCSADYVTRKDHTLEILSVLHQLVGLHRSAADIRATPAVQLLP